jgi:hypothetical protein
MPGKDWSDKELEMLLNARNQGLSNTKILVILPGRTRDGIAQIVRRKGWSDKKLSDKMKSVVPFNQEQHGVFVKFLKKHSMAPFEQIAESWNHTAIPLKWPTVSFGQVSYWIDKLNLPHERSDAWSSDWSKRKRRESRKVVYQQKFREFEREVESEHEKWFELAKKKLKNKKSDKTTIDSNSCACCNNLWPLSEEFFTYLPNSFSFSSKRLRDFQTGFCKFCDWRIRKELSLKRAFKINVSNILETRRDSRRVGFDRAFEKIIEAAKLSRDQRFKSAKRKLHTRTCIRCTETWELNRKFFRENRGTSDGKATFRALCTFCDHYYETAIDRRKRDKLTYRDLVNERNNYLAEARKQERKKRRESAIKQNELLLSEFPDLSMKSCTACNHFWIDQEPIAHKFWTVGRYTSRVTGIWFYSVSSVCLFCKADKKVKENSNRK